ncbi:MAG: RNA-binding S4 domain-containing protein [Deltaproteobacteria bacterium]|nr:RNA-binding S4 domain-containing protein [Deltaproteobacteria bacterium]
MDAVRLDTWLWAARFYKTRSQAKEACDAGHVWVNGDVAKPARSVRPDDELRVRVGDWPRLARVIATSEVRGPAPVARLLYEDLTPPRPARSAPVATRDPGAGRPTKRDRRDTERWRGR